MIRGALTNSSHRLPRNGDRHSRLWQKRLRRRNAPPAVAFCTQEPRRAPAPRSLATLLQQTDRRLDRIEALRWQASARAALRGL